MVWRPVCPIFAPPVGAHDATYHQVAFNLLIKAGQRYKVDGDYQETPESGALVERQDFINGYILGVIDSLGILRQRNTSFRQRPALSVN